MRTCTRRLEFDAAHRVMRHESKCSNLHGHRYVVDVTVAAKQLDSVGRVVDFGLVKERVGGWIDATLDHGTIINRDDLDLATLLIAKSWRRFAIDGEPTAENLAEVIAKKSAELLPEFEVVRVRVYETPNCWADFP